MRLGHMLLAALLFALAGAPVQGQEAQPQAERPGVLKLLPQDSTSDRSIETADGPLAYTATAGTLALYGQDGKQIAAIFYTAYVAKGRPGSKPRPITFAFNGGPGAASAYLHLGLVGPRVLDFGERLDATEARIVDNPATWLRFTDLVLIDPIGTGWSRTARADDAANFQKVDSDASSLAKAIALYVVKNKRADSPKYLLGESYGGFRAVKLATALKNEQSIIVSGAVMVSPFLEGALLFDADRFALAAALELPSLAAAEMQRHKRFDPARLREAETFALGEYLSLLAGPAPTGEKAEAFYRKVSDLTGVPMAVVERNRGFLGDAFAKNLDGKTGTVASLYDAGFLVADPSPESDRKEGEDPVLDGFTRAYGGVFSNYAQNELGFKTPMTYMLLDNETNRRWEWGGQGQSIFRASVTDEMKDLLSVLPSFRLLVAHGYGDMITPYSVTRYIFDHFPPQLTAGRVTQKAYPGGHMFYTDPAVRADMSKDAADFYAKAAGRASP